MACSIFLIIFLIVCAYSKHIHQNTTCTSSSWTDHVNAHIKHKYLKGLKRRALVTGAFGFIGSNLIDFLAFKLQFHVIALNDLSEIVLSNLEEFKSKGGIIEVGDFKNTTFLSRIFQSYGPFDYIYHIGTEGQTHFTRRNINHDSNYVGSTNVLNEARRQKPVVKAFVFITTVAAAYAPTSDGHSPSFIDTSLQFSKSRNGTPKIQFESDLQTANNMSGLKYIIFHINSVYGPRQNIADNFRNIIGKFMNQVKQNENITIYGSGDQKRVFSFISDVVNIIGASVLFPRAYNDDFSVDNDQEYTLNELATSVIDAMRNVSKTQLNTTIINLDSRKEVVVNSFSINDGKLRCVFNPPPTVSLNTGLQLTADYVLYKIRDNGFMKYKYSAVIVEPRKHHALSYVLQNFLQNLSNEWIIIILHGTENFNFLKNIIKTHLPQYTDRIRTHSLNVSSCDRFSYNELLFDQHFYDFIPTDIHLIFQVDTVICEERKDVINSFLKYDYVGAPWKNVPVKGYGEFNVGNGGLSLRRKHKVLDKIKNCPRSEEEKDRKSLNYLLEDVFFSQSKCGSLFIPSFEEAKQFCMETTFSLHSFGVHQVWGKHNISMINKKMNSCQSLKRLYQLSVKPKRKGIFKFLYGIYDAIHYIFTGI